MVFKRAIEIFFLVCAFPMAVASAFGRWKLIYTIFAHSCALVPGLPGDYLRIAYYRLTLAECALSSRISFGSFLAHPEARIGPGVYIGSYCVIGRAQIGARTQIASAVHILSGRHQHARGAQGQISGADRGEFIQVSIGADCWIGAAAVVMADVGPGTTIGAGAVVSRVIPGGVVAFGNPARVVKDAVEG